MIIHLCPESDAALPPSILEVQEALNTFTKNCGWYEDILEIDDLGTIYVSDCTNNQLAPIFATLFLLVEKYPLIFSYQFRKANKKEELPQIGFWIEQSLFLQAVEILKKTKIIPGSLNNKVAVTK